MVLAAIVASGTASSAEQEIAAGLPQPVRSEEFASLRTGSPFLRSLNLSEAYILTGTVRIDDEIYIALMDRESGETDLISSAANSEGWKLVGLEGDSSELQQITAQVSNPGGEIFAIRFDERQFEPQNGGLRPGGIRGSGSGEKAPVPERDYREGISGDGHRGPTPPELVQKLSRLDENTRNRLIQEIREIRGRGVSSEERQVLFTRMVDEAVRQRR